MKNGIMIMVLFFVALSCKSKKIVGDGEGQKLKSEKVTMKAILGEFPENSNPVKIEKVEIKGNKMSIDVSYSGGCKDHEFQLIGSEMVAKSMPPQRTIMLFHNANEDMCRAMIMKTIEFDIADLAYKKEQKDEIILILNNEKYKYVFE